MSIYCDTVKHENTKELKPTLRSKLLPKEIESDKSRGAYILSIVVEFIIMGLAFILGKSVCANTGDVETLIMSWTRKIPPTQL